MVFEFGGKEVSQTSPEEHTRGKEDGIEVGPPRSPQGTRPLPRPHPPRHQPRRADVRDALADGARRRRCIFAEEGHDDDRPLLDPCGGQGGRLREL